MFKYTKVVTERKLLEEQVDSLKRQIAAMRQQEYDMMRDHEAELQNLFEKYVDPLKEKLEDAEFRIQQLTNANSHQMFQSLKEKLLNVSHKLSLTEDVLMSNKRMLQDAIIERDKMRKFIDTLPESYRAAWSIILMKDQEKKE